MTTAKEKSKPKSGKYTRPQAKGTGSNQPKRPFRTNELEDLKVVKAKMEVQEESNKPVASSKDLFSQDAYDDAPNKITTVDKPVAETETNPNPDMATKTAKTKKKKTTGKATSTSTKKKNTGTKKVKASPVAEKTSTVADAIKEVVAAKPEVHTPEQNEGVEPELQHPIVDQGSDDVDLKLKRTLKYSRFKINESNRIINTRHVNDLKKKISIKNLLHSNPITVNSDYEVLDGQHRLEAAKQLGLPIYYIVDDYMDVKDIAVINSTSKGWKLDDYLHHYKTEEKAAGNENGQYAQLAEFAEKYNVNLFNAIGLLSNRNSQPNAELINKFKRGEFKVVDMEHAIRIAKLRDSFKLFAPDFYKSKNFVNSLSKVARNENFDEDVMLKKMGQQSERLMKCATVEGYLNSLVDIYNFRTRKDQRLHLESK
jgi:hypothetical protein